MPDSIFDINHISEMDGVLTATIRIDSGHPVFQGHFPGAPVTPGVVEMMMVRDVLRQYLGQKLNLKTLRSCKFLEILNPLITPEIELNIRYKQGELLEATASASSGSSTFFKLQAAYI